MKRSKKWRAAAELFNRDEMHTPIAALRLVKQSATTKFDATVDVAVVLGVDPRKADQAVRSTVNLPHGTGKTARVLVFAGGEQAEAARAAELITLVATNCLKKLLAVGLTSIQSLQPQT